MQSKAVKVVTGIAGLALLTALVAPRMGRGEQDVPAPLQPDSSQSGNSEPLERAPNLQLVREQVESSDKASLPTASLELQPADYIAAVNELLAQHSPAALNTALRTVRALMLEYGDRDPRYEEVLDGVAENLMNSSGEVATRFAASGDFASAGAIIGEVFSLGVQQYLEADLHQYADYRAFVSAVLEQASMDESSKLRRSVARSLEFADTRKELGSQDFDGSFQWRDGLLRFAEKGRIDASAFWDMIEYGEHTKAEGYLANVASEYARELYVNPEGAFEGACVVARLANEEEFTVPGLANSLQTAAAERIRLAGEGRLLSAHAVLVEAERIFSDLQNFGGRDFTSLNPELVRKIAETARQTLLAIEGRPELVSNAWQNVLRRFRIPADGLELR